jgi:hypothetical protein
MSDIPAAARDPIDPRAVLARIDRDLAVNVKLLAEARKFNRERRIVPVTVLGAILAAVIGRLPEIMHAIRWGIPQ